MTILEQALNPDLVATENAKGLLRRPVFPGIGIRSRPPAGHIAVNAYDLRRLELAAQRLVPSSLSTDAVLHEPPVEPRCDLDCDACRDASPEPIVPGPALGLGA